MKNLLIASSVLLATLAGCGSSDSGSNVGAGGATANGAAGASQGSNVGAGGATANGVAGAGQGAMPPGDANGLCSGFVACGGDLVGTWAITGACIKGSSDPTMGHCPTATGMTDISVSGTQTFDAGGTESANVSFAITATYHLPKSCLGGSMCSDIAKANVTAVDAGDHCDVTSTEKKDMVMTSGTYTTSGTSVTVTDTKGSPSTSEYCVKGTTLTFHTSSGGVDSYYAATRK